MKNIIKISEKDLHFIIKECVTSLLEYNGLDDVVDSDELSKMAIQKGFKLIGYHNTNKANLTHFDKRTSGIHFGSLAAATDRGENRDWDDDAENWTHKFFIKAEKPLVVERDFDWERESFDDWLPSNEEAFNDIDFDYYLENNLGWDIIERDNYGNIICKKCIDEILKEHGYDCVIYKNAKEDVGNYSIMIFNPCNAKLACKTYDDNGNEIPLNQRFNTSTDDIRY